MSEKLVLALDFGTAKAVAVAAQPRRDAGIETLALVERPTHGAIRQGVVVNLEAMMGVTKQLVAQIAQQVDRPFDDVRVTIGGSHVQSVDNEERVAVRSGEVTHADMQRVLAAAQQLPLAEDRQLLHALVQEFLLDDWGSATDPLGMSARELGVRLHLVSGSKYATSNLVKCIRRSGLDLSTLMVHALASAEAVLTEDEKRLGVLLLDIGAGTTDLVVYAHGAPRLTRSLSMGGERLTHEIATAFRTPLAEAERIKCQWGAADYPWCDPHEVIEVVSLGDRPVRRLAQQRLVDVLHPLLTALFEEIRTLLFEQGLERQIGAGVVLTGGTAKLSGIEDLAEHVLGWPGRIGVPYLANERHKWEDPAYAAVSGLLHAQWGDGRVWQQRSAASWWQRLLHQWWGTVRNGR